MKTTLEKMIDCVKKREGGRRKGSEAGEEEGTMKDGETEDHGKEGRECKL